jgi:hypothetical protein
MNKLFKIEKIFMFEILKFQNWNLFDFWYSYFGIYVVLNLDLINW